MFQKTLQIILTIPRLDVTCIHSAEPPNPLSPRAKRSLTELTPVRILKEGKVASREVGGHDGVFRRKSWRPRFSAKSPVWRPRLEELWIPGGIRRP